MCILFNVMNSVTFLFIILILIISNVIKIIKPLSIFVDFIFLAIQKRSDDTAIL